MQSRIATVLVAVLYLLSPQAVQPQPTPPPDSALAFLISSAGFDSLRRGGSRPDMIWIAGDAATRVALTPAATARSIVLTPPRDTFVSCPGSTDVAAGPLPGTVGYHVFIRVRADSTGRLYAKAWVSCEFTFRARRRRGFQEGMSWEVAKEPHGWRVIRAYERWIT